MGLGYLLGAAFLGAAVASARGNNKHSTTYRVRVYGNSGYKSAQPTRPQANSKPHNNHSNSNGHYNSSKKEEFFDEYRNVDNKLSRMYNESYGGVGTLKHAIKSNKIQDPSLKKMYPAIKQANSYRGKIAHSKEKWCNIEDPDPRLVEALREVDRMTSNNYSNVGKALYRQNKEHISKGGYHGHSNHKHNHR